MNRRTDPSTGRRGGELRPSTSLPAGEYNATDQASVDELLARLEQAERELLDLRSRLDHTQRLATLGTLTAGIAHEINNFLTPVISYAQLARSRPDDFDLLRKAVEKASGGAEAAAKVAAAVLGYSRLSDGESVADVQAVIDAAVNCLGRDPSKDRIRLNVNVQPGCTVRMKPLALQQVLVNLLINACHAMREQGGEISIAAVTRADGTTLIRVSDNGPGIPEDVAQHLFEPFAPSSESRAEEVPQSKSHGWKRGGTGLGLSICKRLVEEASGRIDAESSPEPGTTFTIIVPTAETQRAKAG